MRPDAPALAIFCHTLKPKDDPFSSDYYWQAYQDLMLALKARGVEVYLVTDNDSYLGDGRFASGYTISGKTSLDNLTKVNNIQVSVVFNRADFMGEDVTTVSAPYVHKIGTDKIEMYKHFARFQPKSVICETKIDVEDAFRQMASELIVVKEPVSYGGHHVYIGPKEEMLLKLPDRYPLLVQEFMDTSAGIPGYGGGVHDMRLSMCGGELIGCYIRQATTGSLHSNVSQGGKMLFMDINEVPEGALAIAKEIDTLFKDHPRYYSVDVMLTAEGWKLLEINTLLALIPVTDGAEAQKTLKRLTDYFASLVTK